MCPVSGAHLIPTTRAPAQLHSTHSSVELTPKQKLRQTLAEHFDALTGPGYLALREDKLIDSTSKYKNVLPEMYLTTCLHIQKIAAILRISEHSSLPKSTLNSLKVVCEQLATDTRLSENNERAICGPGVTQYIENAMDEARHLVDQPSLAEQLVRRKNQITEYILARFVHQNFSGMLNYLGNQIHIQALIWVQLGAVTGKIKHLDLLFVLNQPCFYRLAMMHPQVIQYQKHFLVCVFDQGH